MITIGESSGKLRRASRWREESRVLLCYEKEGLPRLQPEHHLPTGTTDCMWVSASGCLRKLLLLSDSVIHAVTKISPMLTKHDKSSALVGMQSNTFRICSIRSLSWVPGMLESGSGPVNWAASGARGNAKRKKNMEGDRVQIQAW